MVVTKNNYESVKHLYNEGFNNILLSLDYMCDRKDEDLEIIKYNFERVAELYYEKTKNRDRFIFLPFDTKINMHINKMSCLVHRELGSKHVNVGADKNIYPCVQFVGKEEYIIGNCKDGIVKKEISEIIKKSILMKILLVRIALIDIGMIRGVVARIYYQQENQMDYLHLFVKPRE